MFLLPGPKDECPFPGYDVHETDANGDCLFQAIAHQLSIGSGMEPISSSAIRKQLLDFVQFNPLEFEDVSGAGSSA